MCLLHRGDQKFRNSLKDRRAEFAGSRGDRTVQVALMPSGKNAQRRAESSKGGPATSQAAAKSAPASKWESTGGDEEVLCMSAEELKAAAAEALREFAKALKERGALCPDDVLAALVHRAALTGVDEKALVVAVDAVSLPADFRQT